VSPPSHRRSIADVGWTGLGMRIPVAADAVLVVCAAGLHERACAGPFRHAANTGQHRRQASQLCGVA
jgi:hypothetical protein